MENKYEAIIPHYRICIARSSTVNIGQNGTMKCIGALRVLNLAGKGVQFYLAYSFAGFGSNLVQGRLLAKEFQYRFGFKSGFRNIITVLLEQPNV